MHWVKTQHKVIISKEKGFVAFKKIWASVVKKEHNLSNTRWAHVAIVAYPPRSIPCVYDFSNNFDTIK